MQTFDFVNKTGVLNRMPELPIENLILLYYGTREKELTNRSLTLGTPHCHE